MEAESHEFFISLNPDVRTHSLVRAQGRRNQGERPPRFRQELKQNLLLQMPLNAYPTGFLDLPTALRAHVCFSDMRRINLAKLSVTGLPCCTHYRGVGSILDLSG